MAAPSTHARTRVEKFPFVFLASSNPEAVASPEQQQSATSLWAAEGLMAAVVGDLAEQMGIFFFFFFWRSRIFVCVCVRSGLRVGLNSTERSGSVPLIEDDRSLSALI